MEGGLWQDGEVYIHSTCSSRGKKVLVTLGTSRQIDRLFVIRTGSLHGTILGCSRPAGQQQSLLGCTYPNSVYSSVHNRSINGVVAVDPKLPGVGPLYITCIKIKCHIHVYASFTGRRPQRQVSCDPDLMPRATKGSIGGPRPPAKVLQSRAIPLAHAHISRHSSHLTTTPQPREPSRDQLTPLAAAPPHLSERDEEDEEEEESSSEEEEGSPLPGMGGLRHTSGKQKAILAVLALNDMLATMALSILAPFFPKEVCCSELV